MSTHSVSLVAAGITDIGPKAQNEDSWFIQATREGGQLLMLTDGMGGMGRGKEASRTALRALAEHLIANDDPEYDALLTGIREADERVRDMGAHTTGRRPGTTAAIAYIRGGRVTVGWVGDSTVILVRDSEILTMNRSHRLVQKLIDDGLMTEESAKGSPMARLLDRSLGGRPDGDDVKPGLLERWALREGDYLVLCSDGLTDSIPPAEIPDYLQGDDVSEIARTLVTAAKERGIDDNTTVIVATVVDGEPTDGVGMAWDSEEESDHLSLPPTSFRSGIVNAQAIAMMELTEPDEEESERRVKMMLAIAIGVLVVALVIMGATVIGLLYYT